MEEEAACRGVRALAQAIARERVCQVCVCVRERERESVCVCGHIQLV